MTTIKTKAAPATSPELDKALEILAKPKRTRKKAPPKAEAHALLPALKWVAHAQNGSASWAAHCKICDGQAVAYDGAVAAGHDVNVDWQAIPHTERLHAALERAGADASLVVDEYVLTVHGERLTVRVPCLDVLPEIALPPEKVMGFPGDPLLLALRKVIPLCKENAPTVLESAIELNEGCATTTNRNMILQAWHGVPFPRMVLPRAAAAILLRLDPPDAVAWDTSTVTFFWPGKWLRFNLYEPSVFPNTNRIFNPDNAAAAPEGLKEAIEALTPHADDGRLFIERDESFEGIHTSSDAAYYRLALGPTVKTGMSIGLRADMLKLMADVAATIDFDANGKVQFYGDNLRGAIAHMIKG